MAAATTELGVLCELNEKSARVGQWTVKVHAMRLLEYEYALHGKPVQGCKLECFLLSQNSDEYCSGIIRLQKGDKGELATQKSKFFDGSVWTISQVALAKEKTEWLGSSVKVCVDLRKTKTASVLQSLKLMPPAPTPGEEIAEVIKLQSRQRVDVMALTKFIPHPRTQVTKYGPKQIVDVVFVDGSKKESDQNQVEIAVSLCYPTTATGTTALESLRSARAEKNPVNLFGLTCTPTTDRSAVEFSTSQNFLCEVAQGTSAKLVRLRTDADAILGAQATRLPRSGSQIRRGRRETSQANKRR